MGKYMLSLHTFTLIVMLPSTPSNMFPQWNASGSQGGGVKFGDLIDSQDMAGSPPPTAVA